MKKILKWLIPGAIGCLALGLTIFFFWNEWQIRVLAGNDLNSRKNLSYHFIIVTQNKNETFWKEVQAGAQKAARKYNAAVEFRGSDIADEDEELRDVEMAVASKVDGIAVYATSKSKFTPVIGKASKAGIPIVTIESDDRESRRNAYIGPDSFEVGKAAGLLVWKADGKYTRAAIVFGGNFNTNLSFQDSLVKGFASAFPSKAGIRTEIFKSSNAGYFEVEQIITNIVKEHKKINTIVCTSADDTLEAAQVLIDLNKVGQINLIGYNSNAQIVQYIRDRVIYGSIVENPAKMGYDCIRKLVDIKKMKLTSNNINTGINVMTLKNLSESADSKS